MDEKRAISLITAGARTDEDVILGPGDDAALLRHPQDKTLVWTTDVQDEGRHFVHRWLGHDELARRALGVNLSDLAAMGARPWAYLLCVGIPPDAEERDLADMARGLRQAEETWELALAGGHTWRHASGWLLVLSVAGLVPEGEALRRDGAEPGMGLYVSGTLGGAARGLEILRAGRGGPRTDAERGAVDEWLHPEPRLALGYGLRQRHLEASTIDLSDGLSTDLHHLCEASGVGAVVEAELLPYDPSLSDLPLERKLNLAVNGGEDYELLFACPRSRGLKSLHYDRGITRIGEIRPADQGVRLRMEDGTEKDLPPRGHDHLGEGSRDR